MNLVIDTDAKPEACPPPIVITRSPFKDITKAENAY
jgi:hypothetical protein